jgi:hypothetical protein
MKNKKLIIAGLIIVNILVIAVFYLIASDPSLPNRNPNPQHFKTTKQ